MASAEMELPGLKDQKVMSVMQVYQDQKVILDPLDHKDLLDLSALRVTQAPLDLKVLTALTDKADQVLQAQPDQKVMLAQRDPRAIQDQRDQKVMLAKMVKTVLLDLRVLMVKTA